MSTCCTVIQELQRRGVSTCCTVIQELQRRWQQIHADHQKYEEEYHNCAEWQKDMASKVKAAASMDGDQVSLRTKLARLQDMAAGQEDGSRRLQLVHDQAHVVLPNTSLPGKDAINEDLQGLREDWDAIVALLGDSRSRVDAALAAWTAHDEGVVALGAALDEAEQRLRNEAQLQSTLAEKRAQLDRVKVKSARCRLLKYTNFSFIIVFIV